MSKNLVANKFLVTSEKRLVFGEYLYRIQAVKDFERIDGVIDNIAAMDNAIICGDTTLRNHIVVCGDVFIKTGIFDFGEFLVKNETNNEIKKIRLNKSALQWYFDIQKAVKILISQGIEAKMDISSDGASYNFNVVITLKNNLNIRVDKGSIADLAKIG